MSFHIRRSLIIYIQCCSQATVAPRGLNFISYFLATKFCKQTKRTIC